MLMALHSTYLAKLPVRGACSKSELPHAILVYPSDLLPKEDHYSGKPKV